MTALDTSWQERPVIIQYISRNKTINVLFRAYHIAINAIHPGHILQHKTIGYEWTHARTHARTHAHKLYVML